MPEALCYVCRAGTTKVCPLCSRPYCSEHEAPKDDGFCADCMADLGDEITHEPLKDADGTVVEGELLRPVGKYFVSTAGAISEMSDAELEKFTNQYRMKVKECEQSADRFRVMQSICEIETDDRARANVRKLRSVKVKMPGVAKVGIKQSDLKGPTKSPVSAIADAMKKAGITPEQFKTMIANAQKKPDGGAAQ